MFIELAKLRQSCRSYLPRSVPRQIILDGLEAARLAPSACNSQPWHFIVVDEPAMKNTLCQASLNGPYAMNGFAKEAPVIIAVVTEKAPLLTRVAGSLRGTPFWLIDIGIAVEHFVLQAAEAGLSTCWIGWFDERQAAKVLRVPRAKKIVCLISLGYSDETLREKNRKPSQEIYSFNQYHATDTKLHKKEETCPKPS
jgi:nitroreductase